ncbi:flavin reductase family protein [Chelatococcus asaccharovorans]|jgi:flavin reductase (DIM6/NTAB) family NADH-FMN oxidoreductase RutF|uniref:Flavin reductase (DIM6/NTAB) family NADH-FMN oxidoreductase RutF n=1 Tax=Chelatococcus asaccharovorans TaxID=28210 RepID=A0A2V3TZY4_9HYPH|nr:flavin reductase family protein [Chelatococcus asaccharovorans]MBS7704495.1 flavin reductase [Chelatococcus asaccharovorans]PXW55624.1 flavin reductase (DIM6/NTAB) family NADH-FMN oxidoreductase RutF [Chelatococcus asaccharovorans]CAH1663246.1 Flavin reductase (DIM6/NTAB) family NADH-FMN oxidoreductase RutF [Chelatococcus asaccharovorans]CAH1682906.1 Flavin reductase (DIM6/NTAB) family NADH-FMN oxidoreductase RutF [Chelatococcus asaccharovorans]
MNDVADVAEMTAEFRSAMRTLAGAVSVLTVGEGEDRNGFTATSVASFSMEPPRITAFINKNTSSWPMVTRYQAFGVNILAEDQSAIADRFAGRHGTKGQDRFADATWITAVTGAPLLVGALVAIDCRLEEAIERHTHAILIGQVCAVRVADANVDPLLYWHGRYRSIR